MNMIYRVISVACFLCLLGAWSAGCESSTGEENGVLHYWGKRGSHPGFFNKPRAGVWHPEGFLYVTDMTGRIQKFNARGEYLLEWKTPDISNGRPRALALSPEGDIVLSDCHYYTVRVYDPGGKELFSWGKRGDAPGEFALMTDITVDNDGNIYTCQFQENADAVQVFDNQGNFLLRFGSKGKGDGQFERPMGIAVDSKKNIYVADCCNCRVQKFSPRGEFLKKWGEKGEQPRDFYYLYGIKCDKNDRLLVVDYGNCRVAKYDTEGELLALWGGRGIELGKSVNPWDVVTTDEDDVYFLIDSGNDRVQKIRIPDGWGL